MKGKKGTVLFNVSYQSTVSCVDFCFDLLSLHLHSCNADHHEKHFLDDRKSMRLFRHRARQKIFVRVGTLDLPVDYPRSGRALSIMSTIARVIPAGSVQAGLDGVCEGASRRNGTMLNRWSTIKLRCPYLQKTMPVKNTSFFRPGDSV